MIAALGDAHKSLFIIPRIAFKYSRFHGLLNSQIAFFVCCVRRSVDPIPADCSRHGAERVRLVFLRIIVFVPIQTPLADVAGHITHTERAIPFRAERADRQRSKFEELGLEQIETESFGRWLATAFFPLVSPGELGPFGSQSGVLPFRLGRQAILPPFRFLFVRIVKPVDKFLRIHAGDADDRVILTLLELRVTPIPGSDSPFDDRSANGVKTVFGVRIVVGSFNEFAELPHGYFVLADVVVHR